MTEADADGHAASAGGNACTAAALELHRALGTALTTARAPTAELGASRDLVNLVNLVHAPASSGPQKKKMRAANAPGGRPRAKSLFLAFTGSQRRGCAK
jgi:hypothetical protein